MTDISKLVPFTGYYSMNTTPGAFVSIDTIELRSMSASQENASITISVSMDGESATAYPFNEIATFDGVRLNLPGILTLDFSREYRDGRLVSFAGRIGDVNVSGETYFNQVPLSAFVGKYYDVQTSKPALAITNDLEVLFDFSIFSSAHGELQRVQSYSYLPAMYVLIFNGEHVPESTKFTLMLGTASKNGLACSIQSAGFAPRLAESILSLAM